MYFSMQELKHLCSEEDRLVPGVGTQCWKQFSFTLLMRYFALAMLDCVVMAFWRRESVADDELEAGEEAENGEEADESLEEEDDVEDEDEEEELLPPPKKPPNDILVEGE